jgi:prepilin-type N-terminal cleavage/methylation domain-containing protein/prepilin-type processing-associated H-X9-DG protein
MTFGGTSSLIWHSRFRGKSGEQCGFTLVELLVVIGVIAILVGILLPVMSRAIERSRRTACSANLHTLGQSMHIYANEQRGWLPNGNLSWPGDDGAVLVRFCNSYVRHAAVFRCPSDVDPPARVIDTGTYSLPTSARLSYDFYSVWWLPKSGPLLHRLKGEGPLAWDLQGGAANPSSGDGIMQNHGRGGGNVLFADGHAEWQEAAKWDKTNWPHPADAYYPKK